MKSAGYFEFASIPPTLAAARTTTSGLLSLNQFSTDLLSSKSNSFLLGVIRLL